MNQHSQTEVLIIQAPSDLPQQGSTQITRWEWKEHLSEQRLKDKKETMALSNVWQCSSVGLCSDVFPLSPTCFIFLQSATRTSLYCYGSQILFILYTD